MAGNGTLILKFFLNVSRDEQKKRFLERIDEPEKNWKFNAGDVKERGHWNDYMKAYQTMIRETSAPYAPWHVVPADNKWYTRIIVAAAIVEGLASLGLHYPRVTAAQRAELARGADELDVVNSGLEETMINAYNGPRDTRKQHPEVPDLRTAAFLTAIHKVARSYMELGIFP